MKFSFSPYGNNAHISLEQLQELTKEHEIVARAEFSGCEGCYVEVCRWNPASRRYERFCFLKVFGGELDNDWGAEDTATAIAEMISPLKSDHPIFHRMPNWGELDATQNMVKKVLDYLIDHGFPAFQPASFFNMFRLTDEQMQELDRYLCICKDGLIRVRNMQTVIQWKWGEAATLQTYFSYVDQQRNASVPVQPTTEPTLPVQP